MRQVWLGTALAFCACSYEWDALDPRLTDRGPGAPSGGAWVGTGGLPSAPVGTGGVAPVADSGATGGWRPTGPVTDATGGSDSIDSSGGSSGAEVPSAGGDTAASEGGASSTECTFEDPDTGSCYRYVTDQQLDWDAAQDDCEAWGGSLAAITSAQENEFVAARVENETWLGGTDRGRDEEGNWRWGSGESWDFTSFAFGQPDGSGDCLQLWYTSGAAWDDFDCELPLNYVCERDGS